MNDKKKGNGIELAFDVGHSSIGWAVLEPSNEVSNDPSLLGCGVVRFEADDCLASRRRGNRRHFGQSRACRSGTGTRRFGQLARRTGQYYGADWACLGARVG